MAEAPQRRRHRGRHVGRVELEAVVRSESASGRRL
jgi:hypothetical protein